MNYTKIYESLIYKRQSQPPAEYYETHHIIPRCQGGVDEGNVVNLTAREHFVAHWLLVKMFPNDRKLVYAFFCMLRDPHGNRVFTSRYYDIAKNIYVKEQRRRFKSNNPMWTDEARARHSKRMSGSANPMKGRPERNHTAAEHSVYMGDGSVRTYVYGKLGYEDLNIPRPTWILAVRKGTPIPKFNVVKIVKCKG